MGILKKKQQQAKQKQLIWGGSENLDGMKREYENPKGHTYKRFLRSGKRVCDVTSVREDPDGFRLRRKPNSGDTEFVHIGVASRGFKRYIRRASKLSRK